MRAVGLRMMVRLRRSVGLPAVLAGCICRPAAGHDADWRVGSETMTGRFAPTPSGRMHIGNMVAMLAAWLDARSRWQRMVLRIEDIDTPRVLPDADRWIMDDLTWLGMDWDGEPVYQSQRLDLYEQAMKLIPCGSPAAGASPDSGTASHTPFNTSCLLYTSDAADE